jgi:tetrahydromethanopterin:alpha-L-glutamate ligase
MSPVLLMGAGGWHGRALRAAFARLGVRALPMPFGRAGFATRQSSGVRLGRRRKLPAAVLVRAIPAGSFEQVTLRLAVLHALEVQGVAVLNGARAIERCVDKSMTTFLAARAGLPVPESWATEDVAEARAIVAREGLRGRRLVLKPLFGSQGRGLRLLDSPADLPEAEAVGGVFYLQRFVGASQAWSDYRIFVVAGEPIAAMRRRGTGWITNIRQGGHPEAQDPAGELGEVAVQAARAVGAFYAGVDLIRDRTGRLLLLEVNSMPAWQGLQGVATVDIAGHLAAAIVHRLPDMRLAA